MDTTVFLVDPEPDMGAALGKLLALYGIRVLYAADTGSCLALLQQHQDEKGLVIVSLDGGVDGGAELDDLARFVGDVRCRLPVIALTDDVREATHQQALDAGAVDLIYRPLVAAYLFNRLGSLFPDGLVLPQTPPSTMTLEDGSEVTFRMMTPSDAEIEQAFVSGLSPESRYQRFFYGLQRLPPHMLAQLTQVQFPFSYAVIATVSTQGAEQQIGVARYAPTEEEGVAEFAVVVADEWHGRGIATRLLHLVTVAAAIGGGIHRLDGVILRDNKAMRALADKFGFEPVKGGSIEASTVLVSKWLRPGSGAAVDD